MASADNQVGRALKICIFKQLNIDKPFKLLFNTTPQRKTNCFSSAALFKTSGDPT